MKLQQIKTIHDLNYEFFSALAHAKTNESAKKDDS